MNHSYLLTGALWCSLSLACAPTDGSTPQEGSEETGVSEGTGGTAPLGAGGSEGASTNTGGASLGTGGSPTTGGTASMEPGTGGTTSSSGGGTASSGGQEGTTGGSGGASSGSGGQPGTVASDCNQLTGMDTIAVAKDGSGDYERVQDAIRSVSSSNSTDVLIKIAPGIYEEKLEVDRPHLVLCGHKGEQENTILSYGDGADTPDGEGGTLGTSGSYSVNIKANDISAQNLTFRNTRGDGTQAVALLITGQRVQMRDCRMIGRQDTLYVKAGTQYFKDCYLEGTVDYVFGWATAVFDNCTLHNTGGGTAVTAPSTDEDVPFGLVFLGGKLTAAGNVSAGSMALGRNWRAYGAATFIETELGPHISPVGWVKMGDNELSTARFSEYKTKGPGSQPGARAPESKQLSDQEAESYTVGNILAPWMPSYVSSSD